MLLSYFAHRCTEKYRGFILIAPGRPLFSDCAMAEYCCESLSFLATNRDKVGSGYNLCFRHSPEGSGWSYPSRDFAWCCSFPVFFPFSVFLSQLPDKFSWEHLHNKSLAQNPYSRSASGVRLTLLVLESKIRTSGQYREADFESMQGKCFTNWISQILFVRNYLKIFKYRLDE